MSQKDFVPQSYRNSPPSLVLSYRRANKKAFGKSPFVGEKHWSRFLVLEDDLRDLYISNEEYAYTTVFALKGWVISKNLKYLPAPVFCGVWAMSKFMKIYRSKTVSMRQNDEAEALLYGEITVGRYFLVKNLDRPGSFKFSMAVEELWDLVPEIWTLAWKSGEPKRPYAQSVQCLKEEFGVAKARTYTDILKALL